MPVARVGAALAAGLVGLTLGVAAQSGGALLLFTDGQRVLGSAGILLAVVLLSLAAGLWAGDVDGPGAPSRGRWISAAGIFLAAALFGQLWLANGELMGSGAGRAVAVVLLLAAPVYALGALLAVLRARARGRRVRGRRATMGFAAIVLLGAAAGAAVAALVLIPRLDPGPVYLLGAIILIGAGFWEARRTEPTSRKGTKGMEDKVVIVTGVGDHGQVGYAVAETFLERGAKVVVTDIAPAVEDLAEVLSEKGGVVGVPADLTIREDAERVASNARELFGGVDALVNVAGGLSVIKPVAETAADEWQREMDRNARTAFTMSRAALPPLREGGGVIVNFAAPAGLRAEAGLGAYSAAKAAVAALTRSLALEEKEHGVRVNAVAPGMVDTEQNRRAVEDPESVEWVTREQIARVVLFLASDAASGVSGEVVQVLGEGVD